MVCDVHADQQLAVMDGTAPTAVAGYELVVGGNAHGEGGKALGNRQFARYYKQKYKRGDHRSSSAVSTVIASCASTPSLLSWSVTPCLQARRLQRISKIHLSMPVTVY